MELIARCVSVLAVAALFAVDAPVVPAQLAPARNYQAAGVVTDTAGAPIAAVEIALVERVPARTIFAATRSASDGSFSIDRRTDAPLLLRFRRLGYRVLEIRVTMDTMFAERPVRILLHAAPVELASVEIDAETTPRMREFNERRKQFGTGRFIDRAEIVKKAPVFTSDLLRYYPGMQVRPSSKIGSQIRIRGCRPSIFIDGINAEGAELDDVTVPGDIEGIEIYTSWTGIPPQYNDRQARGCGAILVWTRIR